MPAIAIDGNKCTGHGSYAPRKNTTCSSNVFVNGQGVIRVGDTWEEHCVSGICHTSAVEVGSSSVFVNGKAVVRIGDHISANGCKSSVAVGSGNVFVGG
jgi:uncharacterized Zn-binding protein involved in type VI secretion